MKIRRKFFDYENAKELKSEAQFKRAWDRNVADHSAITQAMIAVGRGRWRNAETEKAAKAGDPMALTSLALSAETSALGYRAESFFGQLPYMVHGKTRMTRKKNPRRVKTSGEDRDAAQELQLYAENSEQLVRSQRDPIILNLLRKYAAGTVDWLKSRKLWEYWMESAAQAYVKEFGGGYWFNVFTPETRRYAALQLAGEYERAIKNGEYDFMLHAKGGVHSKRLTALRGVKANPKARDPSHRKLLKSLDTHFARDEKALRKNPDRRLVDAIDPGDRVTIVDRFGKERSGKAVMRSSHGGWVLNMGGAHGTPGIADDSNITRVSKAKNKPSGAAMMLAGRAPNPDAFVIASSLLNGTPLVFDGGNRFSDSRKPALYRTRIAAEDKLATLRKHFKTDVLGRAFVRATQGDEAGAVYGARPRRNPRGLKSGMMDKAKAVVRYHYNLKRPVTTAEVNAEIVNILRREKGGIGLDDSLQHLKSGLEGVGIIFLTGNPRRPKR